MATAIHVITTSTDHYNWCVKETLNEKTLASFLMIQLGEEIEEVDQVYATTDEGEEIKFKFEEDDDE